MSIQLDLEKPLTAADGPMLLEVSLKIPERSFVAITGPSGAGKTTLLRMVAGLLTPQRGRISVGGTPWFSSVERIDQPPQKRRIGFVFQDYALFPNMTVRQNLAYATRDRERIDDLIAMIELSALADRYPETLSNGQKQRVALARAMARGPEILLLDEPLSALDPAMRRKLQDELHALHKKFPITTIMVSHDTAEIYRLADRVIVLDRGQVIADGPPQTMFINRATSHKFSFVGEVLEIVAADCVFVAMIATGQQIIEVVLTDSDRKRIQPGDRVLVGSKAFNPVIKKIER